MWEVVVECKIRALRIDLVRAETTRLQYFAGTPQHDDGALDADEEAFAGISDALQVSATPERMVYLRQLADAIDELPPDERDAVILVHVMGYKEESENPDEETAATRSNCSGRTIRNRLARAAAKLAEFKESI